MLALFTAMFLAPFPVAAQQAPDAGATDSEIRIGNIMPCTGPLAAFSAIGRAEAACFDMVNDRGGINGRKVKFISRASAFASPSGIIEFYVMAGLSRPSTLFLLNGYEERGCPAQGPGMATFPNYFFCP